MKMINFMKCLPKVQENYRKLENSFQFSPQKKKNNKNK